VLVQTADPAPAPAPAPAQQQQQPTQQQPAQAPAPPAQQPVLAPVTQTIVTPVAPVGPEPTVLAPLRSGATGHQAPGLTTAAAPKATLVSPVLAEESSAPVLTVDPTAPVLAVAPDGLPEAAPAPAPTIVDRASAAVRRDAALRPLLEPVIAETVAPAPTPEGPQAGTGGEGASTGGDEPLPLFPPNDPSESPTGLGAPSSGASAHGATGVVAILTAFLLLFVPRIVRRLRPSTSLVPLVGYRVVLERPG
jgi:hypothetical protein